MLSIIDEMLIGLVWKLEVGVKWGGWGLTRGLRGRVGRFGVSIVRTNHITHQHKKGYMPSGPIAAPLWSLCVCVRAQYISPGLFWQSYTTQRDSCTSS